MTDMNPIHKPGGPDVAWSRVNIAEAFPGVLTPLNWTFLHDVTTLAVRETYYRIGAWPRSVIATSDRPDDDLWGIFYGRCAGNLDNQRELGDRMPGTSGDDIERQIFGGVRPGVTSRNQPGRYPIVLAKLIWQIRTLPRRVTQVAAANESWWQRSVFDENVSSIAGAQALLREAEQYFRVAMQTNSMCAFISSIFIEQLEKIRASGAPGSNALMTGYGSFLELEVMKDVWAAAHGHRSVDEVIRRHGYHGTNEGEIASRSWREEPSALRAICAGYARRAEAQSPSAIEAARRGERESAERQLLAMTPALKRGSLKMTLSMGRQFIPLREQTKASFVRALDVARFAARVIGAELHASGRVRDPEDVFMLTFDELRSIPAGDLQPRIAERRRVHAQYQEFDLPESWTGTPVPVTSIEPSRTSFNAIGASPGRVTGPVRIIHHPGEADDLADGEIMVCAVTDPGWTSLLVLCAGVITDTGSAMSHAALVAREMGIPCVVGTGTATRDLSTGDVVELDGAAGTVNVIKQAEQPKEGASMIKFFGLLAKRDDVTDEYFHDHWRTVHGPMVEYISGIEKYVQAHRQPLPVDPFQVSPYEGLAEGWFLSLESVAGFGTDPGYLEHAAKDEPNFIDMERIGFVAVEEADRWGDCGDGNASKLLCLLKRGGGDGDVLSASLPSAEELGRQVGGAVGAIRYDAIPMGEDGAIYDGVLELFMPDSAAAAAAAPTVAKALGRDGTVDLTRSAALAVDEYRIK
jgi:phosphohistidine swiveling domain-containing protein